MWTELNPINIFLLLHLTLFVEILENPWEQISRPSRLTSWLVDCGEVCCAVLWCPCVPCLVSQVAENDNHFFQSVVRVLYSPAPLTGRFFILPDRREKTFFSFFSIKSQFVAALEFRHKYRHSLDRHTLLGEKNCLKTVGYLFRFY